MKKSQTNRGFDLIEFEDDRGTPCSIQESGSVLPAVWIGVNDPSPKIMASQAKAFGISTVETSGFVPYPIPKEVSLTTRMFLTKPQLREFIDELERYHKKMPDP